MPFGDLSMTFLMHACATGNTERVRQYLEPLKKDPEALEQELAAADDWAGSTPLHWAAFAGNARVVEMLLEVGAKVNQHNQRDASLPIHLAARYGKTACLIALADHSLGRACVNTCNKLGNTALHECAYEGRAEGAEALIQRGARMETCNMPEKGGLTPLLAAIEYGRLAVVQVLLRNGANMHAAPLDPRAIKPPRCLRRSGITAPSLKRRNTSYFRRSANMDTPPETDIGALRRIEIADEPAISLALSASHLHVALELLLWRFRQGGGPPKIFTAQHLKSIVFEIWALEGIGEVTINVAHFTRLFTVFLLCTRPQFSPSAPWYHETSGSSPTQLSTSSAGLRTSADMPRGARAAAPSRGANAPASTDGDPSTSAGAGDPEAAGTGTAVPVPMEPAVTRAKSAPPAPVSTPVAAIPSNPVLLALQLAAKCDARAQQKTRDRLVNERLSDAAVLFEHLASGLLDCAARAAVQAEERKQYNPWRMGTGSIHPEVARDYFIHECIEHAAEHELKIFIAHPLVYMQLHELFWPTPRDASAPLLNHDDRSTHRTSSRQSLFDTPPASARSSACSGALTPPPLSHSIHGSSKDFLGEGNGGSGTATFLRSACLVGGMGCLNIAALPLLVILPIGLEHDLEEWMRAKVTRGELPFGLVWLLPSGRFGLWFVSAFALACVITVLPPVPSDLTAWDAGLLAYTLGWMLTEVQQLASDRRKYGPAGTRKYLSDTFNLLDLSMILALAVLLITRSATAILGTPDYARWVALLPSAQHASYAHFAHDRLVTAEVPCQALLALIAWLRLVEILFLFPQTGPLLLMAIRMMKDLMQFLILFLFVVVAFGCSFFVLITAEVSDSTAAGSAATHAVRTGAQTAQHDVTITSVSVPHVVQLLVQGTLKGESDYVLEQMQIDSAVAWPLMFLFGVVVVLLLLNLLIARFAKTFDMVYENVEHNFKVAFARVVMDGYNKDVLPPPLNLPRTLVLIIYTQLRGSHCVHRFCRTLASRLPRDTPPVLVHWLLEDHTVASASGGGGVFHHHHANHHGSGYQLLGGHDRRMSQDRRSRPEDDTTIASHEKQTGYEEELAAAAAEQAREIDAFLRKAVDPQVGLLPEGVVEYVLNHQHDVAREERWRTQLQKEMHSIEQAMRREERRGPAATQQQFQQLERSFSEMRTSMSRFEEKEAVAQARRVRDLEDTVSALTQQLQELSMAGFSSRGSSPRTPQMLSKWEFDGVAASRMTPSPPLLADEGTDPNAFVRAEMSAPPAAFCRTVNPEGDDSGGDEDLPSADKWAPGLMEASAPPQVAAGRAVSFSPVLSVAPTPADVPDAAANLNCSGASAASPSAAPVRPAPVPTAAPSERPYDEGSLSRLMKQGSGKWGI